jgi:hypothetical protein
MTLMGASVGGALLIVLVLIVVFLGAGYALTRGGSGIDEHPRQDREADQRDEG